MSVSDGAYRQKMLQTWLWCRSGSPRTQTTLRAAMLDFIWRIWRRIPVHAGSRRLIEQLQQRDIAWGIVTNKPAAYAEPLMALYFREQPSLPHLS